MKTKADGAKMIFEELHDFDPYAFDLLHEAMGAAGKNVEKGDKVVITEWGKQNGISKFGEEGIVAVTSQRNRGHYISVRPLNRKTASSYWSGFWRKK